MRELIWPGMIAAALLLGACQSSRPANDASELRDIETQQQAIERIEREGAQQRSGRGP